MTNKSQIPIFLCLFGTWIDSSQSYEFSPKWQFFVSSFEKSGFFFKGKPEVKCPEELLLVVDFQKKSISKKTLRLFPKERRILICVEPKVVNPGQYLKSVHLLFGTCFVPTGNQKVSHLDQVWQSGYLDLDNYDRTLTVPKIESRIYDLGIINQNKFSAVKNELYSLRRNVIRSISKQNDLKMAVAGLDWNKNFAWVAAKQIFAAVIALKSRCFPHFSNFNTLKASSSVRFLGRVSSEIEFNSSIKIAIVIENEPTYTSEKLINALLAGSAVVYVGPDCVSDEFDGIVWKANPTVESVCEQIELARLNLPSSKFVLKTALNSRLFSQHDYKTSTGVMKNTLAKLLSR